MPVPGCQTYRYRQRRKFACELWAFHASGNRHAGFSEPRHYPPLFRCQAMCRLALPTIVSGSRAGHQAKGPLSYLNIIRMLDRPGGLLRPRHRHSREGWGATYLRPAGIPSRPRRCPQSAIPVAGPIAAGTSYQDEPQRRRHVRGERAARARVRSRAGRMTHSPARHLRACGGSCLVAAFPTALVPFEPRENRRRLGRAVRGAACDAAMARTGDLDQRGGHAAQS